MTQLTNDSKTNIKLVRDLSLKCYPNNKLLADLTFIQAILEGGLKTSPPSKLSLEYNNLFGIKGLGTGKIINGIMRNNIILPTHEYYSGEMHEVDQRFAVNTSVEDSLEQHKKLLSLSRYSDLNIANTFDEIADWVQEDGYATDPNYSQLLKDLYKEFVE